MQENNGIERERKFLIRYPDTALLRAQDGCIVTEIKQTYLLCHDGSMRVRKAVCDGSTVYIRNVKKRISDMSQYENERFISEEAYSELLLCADSERKPVFKTRYAVPYMGHIVEIDVYPFWGDRAVLEVELSSEDESFELPPYITVIKEVTGDKRYSNKALAKEIVTEEL